MTKALEKARVPDASKLAEYMYQFAKSERIIQ